MVILILFAFLGGIVTILSPCILPILPIILSGGTTDDKKRPLRIITGFIVSFTFFTLFLSGIIKATGLSADVLRFAAVSIIAFFGISMIAGKELFRVSFIPKTTNAFLLGASLGLVWTPCVGPILASIITLAATGNTGFDSVVVTLAYASGTAIPLFAIMHGVRILPVKNLQKLFGFLMILTAIAIFFSWDRKFQTYILEKFPSYGTGLTKLEDNAIVRSNLKSLKEGTIMETAPEFIAGGEWFNSKHLIMKELRGKVVLVDFWTYTCINCIRTLPYLKTWHEKYKDKGLVIVGVHTPEFAFEKNPNNVAKALKDFGITYPVMQDNEYATWQAYNNHYWPAKYLIDKNGKIQYTHFGEGDYDETEKKIQELLSVDQPINNPAYDVQSRTPEIYLGALRGDYSQISIIGDYTKSDEYAMPKKGSTLTLHYNAAKVFLVMRGNGQVKVFLDGNFVQTITMNADKLYDLIDLSVGGEHILKLEFLDDTIELYAFTFG